METRKLYYEDCHLQEFTATVLGCVPAGSRYLVALDATAFYPEGGGQACDIGMLNDVQVLDVREDSLSGDVVHLCDGPLAEGQTVRGVIDYSHRFERMQQHTGEHIVSGIVHRMFGFHNVGFHMGADVVTIDFDGMVPLDTLAQIEKEANEAVWKNLPVKCWYPTQEELPCVGYRSKKEIPWPVRIVEIPGYDKCACCGVHVAQTGEIGLIKLFSCVKFHQGVRIEMACGGKAFDMLSRVYEQNRLVSQAFSAKILETGAAAQRMNEALAREKFRAVGLEKRVFSAIAEDFSGKGNVVHFEQDLTPGALRELAEAIAKSCGGTAAVFSGDDDAGYCMCLASRNTDVRPLGRDVFQALSGKGGGKADAVQGTLKASKDQIQAYFTQKR